MNRLLPVLFIWLMLYSLSAVAVTPQQEVEEDSAQVLQAFAQGDDEKSEIVAIDDQTKRIVMFVMGVPLLILLLATTALGVAMGVYGKPVYVPHMICAGLSICLAIGHAVAGIVWFYPF